MESARPDYEKSVSNFNYNEVREFYIFLTEFGKKSPLETDNIFDTVRKKFIIYLNQLSKNDIRQSDMLLSLIPTLKIILSKLNESKESLARYEYLINCMTQGIKQNKNAHFTKNLDDESYNLADLIQEFSELDAKMRDQVNNKAYIPTQITTGLGLAFIESANPKKIADSGKGDEQYAAERELQQAKELIDTALYEYENENFAKVNSSLIDIVTIINKAERTRLNSANTRNFNDLKNEFTLFVLDLFNAIYDNKQLPFEKAVNNLNQLIEYLNVIDLTSIKHLRLLSLMHSKLAHMYSINNARQNNSYEIQAINFEAAMRLEMQIMEKITQQIDRQGVAVNVSAMVSRILNLRINSATSYAEKDSNNEEDIIIKFDNINKACLHCLTLINEMKEFALTYSSVIDIKKINEQLDMYCIKINDLLVHNHNQYINYFSAKANHLTENGKLEQASACLDQMKRALPFYEKANFAHKGLIIGMATFKLTKAKLYISYADSVPNDHQLQETRYVAAMELLRDLFANRLTDDKALLLKTYEKIINLYWQQINITNLAGNHPQTKLYVDRLKRELELLDKTFSKFELPFKFNKTIREITAGVKTIELLISFPEKEVGVATNAVNITLFGQSVPHAQTKDNSQDKDKTVTQDKKI